MQGEGGKRFESVFKPVTIKVDHDIKVGKERMGVMERQRTEDLQHLENYLVEVLSVLERG